MYVVAGPDSSGTLTDVGGFYNGPDIGSYQVIDSNTFTLTIDDTRTGEEPFTITCTLATATTGTCTDDDATFTAPIRKISDPASCSGTWSGNLTYTGGTPDHTVDFSVNTEGVITMNSTTLTGTVTGKLYCDGTEAIGFLRTGAVTSEREIKIDAAWDGAQSITGVGFDVDDGCSGGTPNLCVNGTVSLTKLVRAHPGYTTTISGDLCIKPLSLSPSSTAKIKNTFNINELQVFAHFLLHYIFEI